MLQMQLQEMVVFADILPVGNCNYDNNYYIIFIICFN